jgi:hypothetical protein
MAIAFDTELTDSLLEDDIPCEIKGDVSLQFCGKPSVARIKRPCQCIDIALWFFVCAECLEDVKAGKVLCASCRMAASEYVYI